MGLSGKFHKLQTICQFVDQFLCLFPSETRVCDGFSVDVVTDLLVTVFDITFDHKTFHHIVDIFGNAAVFKHFLGNTDLLFKMFAGVCVVCIYDNSHIFKNESLRVNDGVTRIAFAGKISVKKGVESLIRSLDYLEYEKERIELLLAGGAGNEEEYEQIVELAKKCPYKVTFLGKLPQKELAKVYNSCDIFALLSFSEGLPLTVIEALACGDRVVMTDLPGVKEWIDTYAPGADIRYVTLPLMRNVDEAVPATLPDFERRIGQRIWESVEAGKTKEVDVSGLSWTKIAGEVLKVLSLTS